MTTIRRLLRSPLFTSVVVAVLSVFVDALGDKRRKARWNGEDSFDEWR